MYNEYICRYTIIVPWWFQHKITLFFISAGIFKKNLLFLREVFFCEGKMKNLLNFTAINILIFEMESQKVINYSADMSMTFLQLILLGFMSPSNYKS